MIEYKNSSWNGIFSNTQYHKKLTLELFDKIEFKEIKKDNYITKNINSISINYVGQRDGKIIDYHIEKVGSNIDGLAKKGDYHIYVIGYAQNTISKNYYTDYYILHK